MFRAGGAWQSLAGQDGLHRWPGPGLSCLVSTFLRLAGCQAGDTATNRTDWVLPAKSEHVHGDPCLLSQHTVAEVGGPEIQG